MSTLDILKYNVQLSENRKQRAFVIKSVLICLYLVSTLKVLMKKDDT